jgi:hypothetical protein
MRIEDLNRGNVRLIAVMVAAFHEQFAPALQRRKVMRRLRDADADHKPARDPFN